MKDCDPRDIAIKGFFLGPKAENGDWLRSKWIEMIDTWMGWRKRSFPEDGAVISEHDRETPEFRRTLARLDSNVAEVIAALEKENPKFTPRYMAHMVSDVSLPALLGHVCALFHNPNNTSKEVSQVTSRLEREAIAGLAVMIGFGAEARGHFTSGGTVANFEAIWRAARRLDRRLGLFLNLRGKGIDIELLSCAHIPDSRFNELAASNAVSETDLEALSLLRLGPFRWNEEYMKYCGKPFPGPVMLVPAHRHYSWAKGASIFGIGEDSLWPVALDRHGRLDCADLGRQLKRCEREGRPVLIAVSVAGTTELGCVDPVGEVQDVLDEHGRSRGQEIWHHVDAAYGGYFASLLRGEDCGPELNESVMRAFAAISRAHSVTLDPHKLGFVPYSCGAFLSRDDEHYETRGFAAAYLRDNNRSQWTSTLEGSRGGAGATATWLSNRSLGLDSQGYGRLLNKGLEARSALLSVLAAELPEALVIGESDLNIVCFSLTSPENKLSAMNERTLQVFSHFEASPRFAVSKTALRAEHYEPLLKPLAERHSILADDDHWTLIRLVLMNPFSTSKESNTDFISEFAAELKRAVGAEIRRPQAPEDR